MKIGSGDGSSSGSSQAKQFPVTRMLTTAGNMVANANTALAQHEAAWARIQNYINTFPGFMQGPVRAVLEAYEKRLRDSYQWQIDCANALVAGAEAAGATDTQIAQLFTAYEGYDATDTGRHVGGGRGWVR